MVVRHPMTLRPMTTAPVEYALDHADDDMEVTRKKRIVVIDILADLAKACMEDNENLASRCNEKVATMLGAIGHKNVSLTREIAFVCGSRDISSPAFLLIGLPMLGWASAADGLMGRTRPPKL